MIETINGLHLERAKSTRFLDSQIIQAVNTAINDFFRDRIGNIKEMKPYSDESNETVVEELRTLIKEQPFNSVTSDTVPYPADFSRLKNISATVNGITARCKYISDEEIEDALRDSFLKPKVHKTRPIYYWTQGASGMKIYHGSSHSVQNALVKYYSKPSQVSIGFETHKIDNTGTLSIGLEYICYEETNLNVGMSNYTYPAGYVFTATGTAIISGVVLPMSVIVNCDLPDETHHEICKNAAEYLLISTGELNQGQFMNKKTNEV